MVGSLNVYKTPKSDYYFILFIIILLIIVFIYGYFREQKKLHSKDSKIICGEFIQFIIRADGSNERSKHIDYFQIRDKKNHIYEFAKHGNIFKKIYSPYYKKNLNILYKVKKGEKLCITYNPNFIEGSTIYLISIAKQ